MHCLPWYKCGFAIDNVHVCVWFSPQIQQLNFTLILKDIGASVPTVSPIYLCTPPIELNEHFSCVTFCLESYKMKLSLIRCITERGKSQNCIVCVIQCSHVQLAYSPSSSEFSYVCTSVFWLFSAFFFPLEVTSKTRLQKSCVCRILLCHYL